jgi:hypothetical protein
MPGKTHSGRLRIGSDAASNSSGSCIAGRSGCEAGCSVFDELFKVSVQLVDEMVLVGRDLLTLESFDEAFAEGVVVKIAGAAHAGQDAVDLQHSAGKDSNQ